MPKYPHFAAFQVKPDCLRDKTGWVVPEGQEGWVLRETGLGAPPPSTTVDATAQLLETSNLKKTLERLAKLVGKVDLDPKDIGIE